jgi:hypothetical protein
LKGAAEDGAVRTFVVRVWVPAEPECGGEEHGLHGVVERVGSERSQSFSGAESLLAFLQAESRDQQDDRQEAPPKPGDPAHGRGELE